MNVEKFLHQQHVPFNVLPHNRTYTAQDMAATLHVPGRNVAKTVVLRTDGGLAMAVVPATRHVDLQMARSALGAGSVELAPESELRSAFSDCELGAVPPFGSQYGIRTLVDEDLADDEYIVFEGNSHDTAISMRFADFVRVEHPAVAAIVC